VKLSSFLSLIISLVFFVGCNTNAKQNKNRENLTSKNQSKTYLPKLVTDQLAKEVEEQSGMVYYNNLFWVNNDSDCPAELYAYDLSGKLKKTIKILNANNIDWEDLTDDEDFFYIGDFGNNFGIRKNLRILRVAKSEIGESEKIELNADIITFDWKDQIDFKKRKHDHDFDCEAFFSYGDSLYLFTKNWANYKTRMYVMNKKLTHHSLQPKMEFDIDFMVTGADISSDGKNLALVGYKDYKTYMYLFANYSELNFDQGKQVRIDMSPLGGAQTEGVVYDDADSLFISTEATKQPQALYKVDWEQWMN